MLGLLKLGALVFSGIFVAVGVTPLNLFHWMVFIFGGFLIITAARLVLLVVETTDIVFALDSVPAVLAVTRDPLIVYTSNVFAILGLRSLFFLLSDGLHRVRYLKTGLALILGFVGVKMLASNFYEFPIIPSLIIIAGILVGTVLASYFKSYLDTREQLVS